MSSRAARSFNVIVVLLLAAVAAYWYWSPLLAMRSMQAAAEAKDADTFNQYVDYPKLRESLKGQFAARMADAMGTEKGSALETTGGALGAMLGLALVDRMIDALVRPEMIMSSMNRARLELPEPGKPHKAAGDTPNNVRWIIERKGASRVIAFGSDSSQPTTSVTQQVGFVFEREGFATWKLTEVRLPADR